MGGNKKTSGNRHSYQTADYKIFGENKNLYIKKRRTEREGIDINGHHKKTSMELRSWPITSLSIYTCEECLNKMMLSSVLSIKVCAFCSISFNFTSDISPSNTEFCIQFKYLRQSFSIFPTRFSPKSYTRITYISFSTNTS